MSDLKRRLDEAYTAARKGDYVISLEICNAAIVDYPESQDGLRKRAAIYAHKGDMELAIADLTNVVEHDPDEPTDYFFRGWWHLENDEPAQSVEDMTKTLELGQKKDMHYHDQSAHFFRAVAFLRLKRYEEAYADCSYVQDDFLIFLKSGKISKTEIMQEVAAHRKR